MRYLGFSGRILSNPRLASYDSQRYQQRPHLSVSLIYLRDIVGHLLRHEVQLYRLPHQLAPYLGHPQLQRFHYQIEECAEELEHIAQIAAPIRLTMHLPLSIGLTHPQAERQAQALTTINRHARLLHALCPEGVLVGHVGGIYEQRSKAQERCERLIERLDPLARQMFALEHDDRVWSLSDVLTIHERTHIPIVFDVQHHQLHNPEQISLAAGLQQALATWPPERCPKVHFSSPRTEMRIAPGNERPPRLQAPTWNEHSDYAHPFELCQFLRLPAARPFDVMLESKAGDLALFRAREDIARFGLALKASAA